MNKVLPAGFHFPYDFGFIPHTKGEDGDPIDALILNDFPAVVGAVVQCRVLGVICCEQQDSGSSFIRNDRFICAAIASRNFGDAKDLRSLNTSLLKQLPLFFKHYNEAQGKGFRILNTSGATVAHKLIQKARIPAIG